MKLAILTVSDSRTRETDTSGDLLEQSARAAGHEVTARLILVDDRYRLRAQVSNWVIDDQIEAIIISGGTGLTGRDITVEALRPLLDKEIEGFGELFRWLSFRDIGTATIQSRAFAGSANGRLIFCLPGSTNACRLAWDEILLRQLDASNKPCNFATLLPRLRER